MDDYVKDLLIEALNKVKLDIQKCNDDRIQIEAMRENCDALFLENLNKHGEIIAKLKLIDPEGTYE